MENLPESRVDKVTALTIKATKLFIGYFFTIAIFGFVFWMLFYSVLSANLQFVIALRNWYQNTYWNIESLFVKKSGLYTFPPYQPIYTFQVQKSSNKGKITYSLYGKFVSLDLSKELITFRGMDNKNYIFAIGKSNLLSYGNDSTGVKGFFSDTNESFNSNQFPQPEIFSTKNSRPIADGDRIVQIRWDDSRSLSEITKDYAKDPSAVLNKSFPDSFTLIVFKFR